MTETNIDKLISIEEFRAERSPAQKLRQSLLDLMETTKAMAESSADVAKFHKQVSIDKKARYDSLVEVGFTDKQIADFELLK